MCSHLTPRTKSRTDGRTCDRLVTLGVGPELMNDIYYLLPRSQHLLGYITTLTVDDNNS
jgi:hypothetical protein